MFAVTLTIRLALVEALAASVAVKTIVLLPVVAVQLAATLAVIVPLVLTILLTVIPGGMVVAWTVKFPPGVRNLPRRRFVNWPPECLVVWSSRLPAQSSAGSCRALKPRCCCRCC